jgi:hypothetical protein
MPPQQGKGLLDFLGEVADLGAHGCSPSGSGSLSGGWR